MTNRQIADILKNIHLFVLGIALLSPLLIFLISWWSYFTAVLVLVILIPWPIFRGCWLANIEKHYRLLDQPKSDYRNQSFTQHYLEVYFNIRWSRHKVRYINLAFYLVSLGLAMIKIRLS